MKILNLKKKLIPLLVTIFSLSLFVGCSSKPSVDNTQKPSESIDNNSNTNNTTPSNDNNTTDNTTDNTNSSDSTNTNNNSNTVVEKDVRLFYYDVINDKIVFTNKTISVTGKALATALINALKNPVTTEIPGLISPNVSVKSASLNKDSNTVSIDFSKNFVTSQNLGSGTESSYLQTIVNTLGYNLKVDNVIITVDGKPYTSGHIIKNEGESFKVNYDNNHQVTSENSTASKKEVRLFYYDAINDKIVFCNKTVSITDKALVNALVNALKEPINSDIPGIISKEISVKSAKLNNKTNTLTVDFSGNFVKAQNLGGGIEGSVLQAIVNTLGYNLHVDKVIITLDGKPYTSGHIVMKDGESFSVNYDNINEATSK